MGKKIRKIGDTFMENLMIIIGVIFGCFLWVPILLMSPFILNFISKNSQSNLPDEPGDNGPESKEQSTSKPEGGNKK